MTDETARLPARPEPTTTRFRIGELTVLAELGAGAGSRVFHVRRAADGAEYALKVVPAGRRADRRYAEQLRHEFRVGRLLDHPNLARVYAFEVRRDWLFRPTSARLLVEFAPGRPLDRLLPLAPGRALRVFARAAAALEHMHARGVFHADLKPGNLICDSGRGVKLIDFGLAWVAGEPKGRVQGTPQYMAPETAAHKSIDARTDIYNLGATMHHVLAGRALAPVAVGMPVGARAHAARVNAAGGLGAAAPAELCDLIHACLRFDPDHRPQRAGDVRALLDRLAREAE